MSSHAPHKRQRCSHAVAARSSVPERTAVQRESTFADHELDRDQNEEEGEVRNEASNDINNVTAARQQALRQAEAEGFVLQPSDNAAGFKGVSFHTGTSKPYEAKVRRGGKVVSLGGFATAEEAALCYARDNAATGGATLSAPAANKARAAPPPLVTEEARRHEAESVGVDVQGMPTVPAGFVERPGLVADLCKIIERQSSEIAELRRTLAQATGQSSVV